MMNEATGRVIETERGRDLVLLRSLAVSAEELWGYLTDPALTAAWFGPWEGDGRPGASINIIMKFEEGEPAVRARVLGCQSPSRLELETVDDYGSWHLELTVEEDGEYDSLLRFVHHLDDEANVGEVGPGWEYYLDLLVAATEGAEQPEFDQYFPALSVHYLMQI